MVELLPLAFGQAYFGTAFSLFLIKQLYHSDSVVIAQFVGTRYTRRRRGRKETKILNNELSTLPFICPLNTKHISAVPVAVLYGYDGMLFCEQ
jgi:hypothetical protein